MTQHQECSPLSLVILSDISQSQHSTTVVPTFTILAKLVTFEHKSSTFQKGN